METMTLQIIITILLAVNTFTVGIAAKMLFSRLDKQDNNIDAAHNRITQHVEHFHTLPAMHQ